MTLSKHIILTIPVAAASCVISGSWESFAGVVIGGILIDVDHFVEFWHDHGFSFNIGKFFRAGNSGKQTMHYVFLHSYELTFFSFMMVYFSPFPLFFWGVGTGMLLHILLDYFNIINRLGYKWYSFMLFSLVFRLVFLFRRDKIDKIIRRTAET